MNEIEQRRPVWIALASLFLDTDASLFHEAIAETLARSPYTETELRAILVDEVTPVLQWNLLSPAGVWDGFDEEWLVAEIAKRLGKKRRLPNLVSMNEDWAAIALRIAGIRNRA